MPPSLSPSSLSLSLSLFLHPLNGWKKIPPLPLPPPLKWLACFGGGGGGSSHGWWRREARWRTQLRRRRKEGTSMEKKGEGRGCHKREREKEKAQRGSQQPREKERRRGGGAESWDFAGVQNGDSQGGGGSVVGLGREKVSHIENGEEEEQVPFCATRSLSTMFLIRRDRRLSLFPVCMKLKRMYSNSSLYKNIRLLNFFSACPLVHTGRRPRDDDHARSLPSLATVNVARSPCSSTVVHMCGIVAILPTREFKFLSTSS